MKKNIILAFLCIVSIMANAQMVGQFSYAKDGRLYLFLNNNTNYVLTFNGSVYSPLRRTGNSETCTVYPGNGIYLGPTTPWRWQWCEGDRYTITYPNGYTQTWTCTTNDYKGMTNKGKGSCRHAGCSCTKYKMAHDGSGGKCICGHWGYVHN